ncbi:MAG: chemotaxis protein CheX [Planctomycetota bacterium]
MSLETLDLGSAVTSVFESMLGLPIAIADEFHEAEADQPSVTGVISISGDWNGAVIVTVPSALAKAVAAAMFAMDEDALTAAEIEDAVGELSNMVGGATKTMIGGSCAISLPSVTEGVRYRVSIPGAREVAMSRFDCKGDLMTVTVVQGASKSSHTTRKPS